MAFLQFQKTLSGPGHAYLDQIHSLTILAGAAGPELHVASARGGTTTFGLGGNAAVWMTDQSAYATISRSFAQLPTDGFPALISQSRLQDVLDAATSTGASGTQIFARNTGFTGDLVTTIAVTLPGGGTFLYAGFQGQAGITGYQVTTAATATMPTIFAANSQTRDTPDRHLADISAFATAKVGGNTFLFTASASEHGINSFRIGAAGNLALTGFADERQALYVSGLSALAVTEMAGQTYLLATATGSSSLSVLRVDALGRLKLVDSVMDSTDTRFANASAIDVVTAGDRTYAVVAGSDDGITLFTLLPGGRLYQLGSFADTFATSLTNVSALAAAVMGSEIHVFASSSAEPGLTQFRVDLSQQGRTFHANPLGGGATGTALDDVMVGQSGNDTIAGGYGNDIVMDGAGADILYGGGGADAFVLNYDNRTDTIKDFQPNIDKLDLSAWPLLYSVNQITFQTTATGAELRFGQERLILVTVNQAPLSLAQLITPNMLNLMRQLAALEGTALAINGTSGADLMIGGGGHDLFFGSAGSDWMCGGSGLDTASYERSNRPLMLNLRSETLNRGDAAADTYQSIERFIGSRFNDTFIGSNAVDRFVGSLGADLLSGGPGADLFIFRAPGESLALTNAYDVIQDFEFGADRIHLREIDANSRLAGDQAFRFIGKQAYSGAGGELRFVHDIAGNRTFIQADIDGQPGSEFRVALAGQFTVTAQDFLL